MTLHSSSFSGIRGVIGNLLAMHFYFEYRECFQHLLNRRMLMQWCMTALLKSLLFWFTGKVAGVRWEGSKKVFDDDSKGASIDLQPNPSAVRDDEVMANMSQPVSQSHPAPVHDSQDDLPKMKWKKMASAELHKVGQSCDVCNATSICDGDLG